MVTATGSGSIEEEREKGCYFDEFHCNAEPDAEEEPDFIGEYDYSDDELVDSVDDIVDDMVVREDKTIATEANNCNLFVGRIPKFGKLQ